MTAGKRTSVVRVTNVTKDGFWLAVGDRVNFVGFANFPWFRDASAADLRKVELEGPGHLRWPSLDVDLAVESLSNPERFPLVSRVRAPRR